MSGAAAASSNPFNITKANDLTDVEIESLWVDVSSDEEDRALLAAARPASPMPMFILGSKGSGKTHLLRYCSYAIQKIRYANEGLSLIEGVVRDRYIGVYVRCDGLNSGRFAGKRQSDEAWRDLFSYYVELWLAQQALGVAAELVDLAGLGAPGESALVEKLGDLFDKAPRGLHRMTDMLRHVRDLQRELDYLVNNATFTGKLLVDIQATRGRLIFGIPRALAGAIPALKGVSFVYQLDEFENLTSDQQQHVNTLVREREAPATFKIGGRQFGVKTHATFSNGEENLRDSEYEELRLDQQFRSNEKAYRKLARRLAARRLSQTSGSAAPEEDDDLAVLAGWFERPDLDWRSNYYRVLCGSAKSVEREHFIHLENKLDDAIQDESAPGVRNARTIREIIKTLAVEDFPLLEKVNILYLYQDWSRRRSLPEAAERIARQCRAYLGAPDAFAPYKTKLGHFKADLTAQMVRENGERQFYAGVDTFVRMSEGLPRAFITLLKQTYDWALLQREQPFVHGRISLEAQRRGAIAAAEWFYNSMTKAGEDGPRILSAVDRLGQLFRLHRFADKPIESSLIGFSVKETDLSDEASHVLNAARSRCFLVDVFGGQRDRNTSDPTSKLQLNRMLAARWDLPVSRRGIVPLGRADVEAIFCRDQAVQFEVLKRDWDGKLNAPFRLRDPVSLITPLEDMDASAQPSFL